MTDRELMEKYSYLLGQLQDRRREEAERRRTAELLAIRAELPVDHRMRVKAEYHFRAKREGQGWHQFAKRYAAKGPPSYFGIG